MQPLLKNERYTYDDYCLWDSAERWELIEGVPYAMAPAPVAAHQGISGELFFQIRNYLTGKSCKIFHAPFDVRLNADSENDSVGTAIEKERGILKPLLKTTRE